MIDPTKITNYNRSYHDLEAHILFWSFVAGHNAKSTARGLDRFLVELYKISNQNTPFAALRVMLDKWEIVVDLLSKSGLGCWRVKSRTLKELAESKLNLKTCSVEDLEEIFGIGPKTARCFILHTRKDARVAGLDTHVLKFLRNEGYEVPKSTPTGKKYRELEKVFLEKCDEVGKTPAAYDLEIWNYYSKDGAKA